MKKKIISILMSVSMIIGLISANAVSITFDEISNEQKTSESNIYFEEIETEKIETESQNIEDTNINFDDIINSPEAIETSTYNDSNDVWSYSYTGSVEEFTAPYTGKYKLEVWGASGGSSAMDGALGGYAYVEIPLLKDETIYITCGGQGQSVGTGGYNGGGSSTLGGSGGGATSITTTNRGELKNFASYKEEVIVVAGGGGGCYHHVLPNQTAYYDDWNGSEWIPQTKLVDAYTIPGDGGGISGYDSAPQKEASSCDVFTTYPKGGTLSSGYAFGLGESGSSGAGGGWYGGYAGKDYYFSSAGGSGYVVETEFTFDNQNKVNRGNGKAQITYEGNIQRTIKISTNGCGTYNGEEEILLHFNIGEEVHLDELELKEGYQFISYVDYDENRFENSFIMGKENLELKALFYAPLIINTEKDGDNTIRINMSQDDAFEKYYKVFQSKDGTEWYDAALSVNGENIKPSKNMSYAPGSYTYRVLVTGDYKIRLYGAQGGNANSPYGTGIGGKGAYTEGIIHLEKGTILYINIGSAGGNGYYNNYLWSVGVGGFSSDIRANGDSIDDRIMVAAGGGGGAVYTGIVTNGSAGGALQSDGARTIFVHGGTAPSNNYVSNSVGATQTRGGYFTYNDTKYNNGSGTRYGTKESPAGNSGGYGYWCGASGYGNNNVGAGTGGSSYISGYSGCVNFSGYIFSNTTMTAGTRVGSGYGYLDLLTELKVYESYINEVYFFDTKAPNVPSNGTVQSIGDNLTVSWKDNGDNGEKYYHKVESYEKETDQLINTSNILEEYLEAGIKGYYYYVDSNPTGIATTSNSFTNSNSATIERPTTKSYIHIAAIDNAGNISDTYNYEIPSVASYIVKHYKMDLNGNYMLDETIANSETIGINVTPEVKTYEGFTSPRSITKTVLADNSTVIEYYYERNKYPVIYIDKDSNDNELGRTTKQVYFESNVRGADIGSDIADNVYYNQYKYVSDTSATVTTSGATVYRIFEFCKTEATSNLQWNDNNNLDGFRPDKYKLKLKQNGVVIDEVELPSDTTNHTFSDLPKYDVNGNLYQYTFDVDATERYEINFDDAGNLIVEDYQPAHFSVTIPKKITLNGNTGKASYTVSVNGTFYYNDALTVKPDTNFVLTDRSNISHMTGTVIQNKTSFTKKDLSSSVNGNISVNKTYFSGLWKGYFNFDIKFIMQN